jgi:PAS domain S-box-containing protein
MERDGATNEFSELFRVVAETASDAIISIDRDSVILFANPAAERIFGYPLSEILGQQGTLLMPEYLRHLHQAAAHAYVKTGPKTYLVDRTTANGLTQERGRNSFGDFVWRALPRRQTHLHGYFARRIGTQSNRTRVAPFPGKVRQNDSLEPRCDHFAQPAGPPVHRGQRGVRALDGLHRRGSNRQNAFRSRHLVGRFTTFRNSREFAARW